MPIDVLVHSGKDEDEELDPAELDPPPRTIVTTLGGKGGRWDGELGSGRWTPEPLPGERRRVRRRRLVRRRPHDRPGGRDADRRGGAARRPLRRGEHDGPRPVRRAARPARGVTGHRRGARSGALEQLAERVQALDLGGSSASASSRHGSPPRSSGPADSPDAPAQVADVNGGLVVVAHATAAADRTARRARRRSNLRPAAARGATDNASSSTAAASCPCHRPTLVRSCRGRRHVCSRSSAAAAPSTIAGRMDGEILLLGLQDVAALLDPVALLEALGGDVRGGRPRGGRRTRPLCRVGSRAAGCSSCPGTGRAGPRRQARRLVRRQRRARAAAPSGDDLRVRRGDRRAARRAGPPRRSPRCGPRARRRSRSRLAARADARVAAVVGAGPVAAAHLASSPRSRDLDEIRVTAARRGAPGGSPRGATRRARGRRIEARSAAPTSSACAPSAAEPVLDPGWLGAGAHLTSVGYAPPGGELDPRLARAGRLLVETRDAFAPPPAGCAELAGIEPARRPSWGRSSLGERRARGRRRADRLQVDGARSSRTWPPPSVVRRRAAALGAGRRRRVLAGCSACASAPRRSRARRAARRRGRPAASPPRPRPRRRPRRGRRRGRRA